MTSTLIQRSAASPSTPGRVRQTVYNVRDYGAVGDGTTDDTAAMQRAITAAVAAGGGDVLLPPGASYALGHGGLLPHLGVYPSVDYGLWVNGSGVRLLGYGATLVLTAVPSMTAGAFCMLLIGTGGSSDGSSPGDGGTWTDNVGVYGLTFDCSALAAVSDGVHDLNAMSQHIGGGCLVLSHCRYFVVSGTRLVNGYGYDGAITANSGSKYGHIGGNTVLFALKTGIWADGARAVRILGNHVDNAGGNGIHLQANLDNGIAVTTCTVADNHVTGFGNNWQNVVSPSGHGVGGSGASDCIFANNKVTAAPVAASNGTGAKYGLEVQAYSTVAGKAEGSRNTLVGNHLTRTDTGGTTFAVHLTGADANTFDGAALGCLDNHVVGNYLSANWTIGVVLDQQTQRVNIDANHFECTRIVLENVATATSNTFGIQTYGVNAQGRANEMGNSAPVFNPKGALDLSTDQPLYFDKANVFGIFAGTGSPVNVVAAIAGSLYLQYNPTARTTTLWTKQSGTKTDSANWIPIGQGQGNQSQLPTGVVAGERFYALDAHAEHVFDGTNWVAVAQGGLSTNTSVAGGGAIAPTYPFVQVNPGSNITLSASVPITAGTYAGQRVCIVNNHATNTLTIPAGGNVQTVGNIVLAQYNAITLLWTGATWVKVTPVVTP